MKGSLRPLGLMWRGTIEKWLEGGKNRMCWSVWVGQVKGKEVSRMFPDFCLGPLGGQHMQERTSLEG